MLNLFAGLYPFNADALNYSKFFRNEANPSDITENRESSAGNIAHVVMERIISQLGDGILTEFERCAEKDSEWNGADFYGFMYQVWLKSKEQMSSNNEEDKEIDWYPHIKVAPSTSESDEEYDGNDDPLADNLLEFNSEKIRFVDAQVEIINEPDVENRLVTEAPQQIDAKDFQTEDMQSIELSQRNSYHIQDYRTSPLSCSEIRNVRMIKYGQHQQRGKLQESCISSASIKIGAKKKIIELKPVKTTETGRKERTRAEKLFAKIPRGKRRRSFIADDDQSSHLTDDSSAESTPSKTPVKSKRSKFYRRKFKILKSDSEIVLFD